jgi:hypothetical protein
MGRTPDYLPFDVARLRPADRTPSKGNESCFLCRHLHIVPFRRCQYCTLSGADRCPTVKWGFFLILGTAAVGVAAHLFGGATSRVVFMMTGLVTVILLLVINSYSNMQARSRLRLEQLHQELSEQHEFLKELSPLDSLQDCLEYIVKNASERLRCRRVSIMLADDDHRYLRIAAASGLPESVVASTRIPIGERISGQVFRGDRPIHVSHARSATASPLPADSDAFMSGPLLLSGMRWGEVRLGVLSITEPVGRSDFGIDDEFVFSNICEASAVAIYNHMAVAKIKQGNVEFLETLVNALEARDEYTRGHSERVSQYAEAIGRRLMLSDQSMAHLQTVARLHDIGKIGIPDGILQKPGPLTDEEWDAIRAHPTIAAKILAQASVISSAIDAISHHHERLDGSGYPNGLAGTQIPLLARIIGVADTFDAMTSARPYHEPYSVAETIAELQRCRGRLFDPACADAMVEAVKAGEIDDLLPAGTAKLPEGSGAQTAV